MGYQLKIILAVLMMLIVAGLAGVGIHYATKQPADTEVADNKQDKESVAKPADSGKDEDKVEGAGDEAPAGGETAVEKAIGPSFDIVRVEPTGDVVAAGRASAGARVELLLGDKAIASAVANAAGEWALVFDEPLAPGSYDLLLRATGPDGKGDLVEGDRVAIVIEAPDKTPMVAVTRPGEPTEVLQTPESTGETVVAEASAPKAEEAAADVAATAEPSSAASDDEAVSETAPSDTSEQTAAEQTTAEQTIAEPTAGEQATAEQPAAQEQQIAAVEPEAGQGTADAEIPADQSAATATDQAATQEPATAEDKADASGQAASEASTPEVSTPATTAAEVPAPESSAAEAPAPKIKVVIETVEVENSNRLMLSGRAGAGDAVRLYLNNEPLGDVETGADGRWTLSTERAMTPGRYEVRADIVGGDGGVKDRAQVRFDRVQVVEADQQTAESSPSATGDGTAEPSGQSSDVTIVSRTAGAAGASSGAAVGEGAGTSVVVIARGDNLWRIARKIYGRGIRHTVIFEANKKQIGNPDLIYPGQVFTIPVLEGDDNPKG